MRATLAKVLRLAGVGVALSASTSIAHAQGSWTMKAAEAGKTYDVMFGCSLRSPEKLTPANVDEFTRSFEVVRGLPCDVQLGDHGAQYGMQAKYARLQGGGANPFIDPACCKLEMEISQAMFRAILDEQKKAPQP